MKIPNILSLSRIFIIPLLLYLALNNYKTFFITLFILGAITDILDGYLARKLKQETELGSKLDSIADYIYYPFGLITLLIFSPTLIQNHKILIITISTLAIIQIIIKLLLIKNIKSPHYYSSKLSSFSLFILTTYTIIFNYNKTLFYITATIVTIAILENFLPMIKQNKNKKSYFIN